MAIEMTIVMPPFVLDLAGASLDFPIEFSEEIWAEWESRKQEQFGSHWETVLAILSELRQYGVDTHLEAVRAGHLAILASPVHAKSAGRRTDRARDAQSRGTDRK